MSSSAPSEAGPREGRSALAGFRAALEAQSGRRGSDWVDFHRFTAREWRTFWAAFLEWADPPREGDPQPVCTGDDPETARFFPGLRLNWAEALLRPVPGAEDEAAIVALDEAGARAELTRRELRDRVVATARGLRDLGMVPGDRVVAVAGHDAETIVAALATTALGATWSSVAPDLGAAAVRDRFRPLSPRWMFATARTQAHGRAADLAGRITAIAEALPELRAVIQLGTAPLVLTPTHAAPEPGPRPTPPALPPVLPLPSLERPGPFEWPRFPFDHPLFVLFSSGTTGPPKGILHGHGGTLLEHLKEHRLHGDLGPGDRLLFQTTAGWMMWNWQVSALATGAAIVVRDGSPAFPEPDSLWRCVDEERVTVFGTSPAFLRLTEETGIEPRERFPLESLRAIQSTGSVLADDQFHWVGRAVKDVPVQSISGGTDLIGCFVLGHPELPVPPGESQSISLGLDVRAFGEDGRDVPAGEPGELVCTNPFPSRPVGFVDDEDRTRFHDAYFARFPGVWTHGDTIALPAGGSARVLGRSDGILNVRGVRIGPAEITRVAERFEGVAEAMAIEQRAPREPGGSRLVLLLVMREGTELDRPLTLRLKKTLRDEASPNHVPAVVAAVPALPVTRNGKRSERAARDAIHGGPVANEAALANPECLPALRAAVPPTQSV